VAELSLFHAGVLDVVYCGLLCGSACAFSRPVATNNSGSNQLYIQNPENRRFPTRSLFSSLQRAMLRPKHEQHMLQRSLKLAPSVVVPGVESVGHALKPGPYPNSGTPSSAASPPAFHQRFPSPQLQAPPRCPCPPPSHSPSTSVRNLSA
jgi:hypothetical protein